MFRALTVDEWKHWAENGARFEMNLYGFDIYEENYK